MRLFWLNGIILVSLLAPGNPTQAGKKKKPVCNLLDDVVYSEPEEIKALIDKGCDVKVSNKLTGATPLHVAAVMNRTGTIRVLIDAGADINAANKRGWTPLHLAASAGLEEAVEVLLARGADTDCQDLRGRTPLHLAVSHGAEITRMLIEKGAGLEIKSRTGLTPLHSAVVVSSAESVVELIKAGADLEAEENLGRNAMGLARTYHNEEIIELLADPEKARKKVFEKKPCHHRHEHEDEELDLDKIELNGD